MMQRYFMLVFGILLFPLLSGTQAATEDGEVQLYVNAQILTMNPKQPHASAMAVKDGKILAVGDLAAVKKAAGDSYEYYDMDGTTVSPGFIESHEHMMMQGGVLPWADLTPATTRDRDEALAKLRRQDPDEKGWILGFGIEPLLYEGEEGRPTWRQSLDEVSTEMPVFAAHNSGHAAYANTKAFEVAGITKETPNPMGGEFVKDENGELEGYINGRPAWMMLRGFPAVTRETTRHAAEVRARVGITTASELAITAPQYLGHLEEVTSEPHFPVRIVGGLFITMPGLEEVAPRVANYETDLFKVKFIKSWADGSIQGGTGAMTEGYYDFNRAAESGLTDTQEGFNAQVLKMFKLGLWPALHANGDAAMDLALNAIEHARKQTGNTEIRPQLIHCQYVRPEQFDRIKKLGANMTFFATHVYNYGDLHRDRFLGPERAPHISSLKVAFEKGISAAMHDDAPVALPNPLFNMWVAVNRKTRSGKILGPDLRITPEQALAAYTREAAYQFGMEDEVGTLEKGKFADFVVLAKNPLEVDRDDIKDIKIIATVMGGRVTHLALEDLSAP
jgi:predicted amidohydrolase YtcJ